MSILLALSQTDTSVVQLAAVLGCIGVAVSIAASADVFRLGSVVGPARLELHNQLIRLWMAMLVGFCGFVLIPEIYAASRMAQPDISTTRPTTQVTLSPMDTVIANTGSELALLISMVAASAAFRPGGLNQLGFNRTSLPKAAVPGAIGTVIVIPFMYAVMAGTQALWDRIGLVHPNEHPLLELIKEHNVPYLRAAVMISALFIAPPAEELFFRGHLQTGLSYAFYSFRKGKNERDGPSEVARWVAILLTSLAFAAVHPFWTMPPILALSICLGYIYERTGNLWTSILVHMAFNAFNLVTFWSQLSSH